MKSVTIGERTFQYQTYWERHGEDIGSDPVTVFYEGTEIRSRKKYRLFGPLITWYEPREVFRIYANSENDQLSKGWWRKQITEKIELLNRKEEIERGELC
jgi:hypothetical protein